MLKPEMEINLYRVIQESLNNIIKHSAAAEAQITIRHSKNTIQVTIRDNGKGFDFDRHFTRADDAESFGLMGIYERSRILGTVPSIETASGKGTTIRLEIKI